MMIFQEPIIDALMEASIQESIIQELGIQISVIQESKMQVPTILMVRRTFQGSKNQWDLKDWRTTEGSRIWAKFEDLRRRNLHAHTTACQKEMHEYGDQNVTKILVHWKISFDEDAISQQHLVRKVFSRGGKC